MSDDQKAAQINATQAILAASDTLLMSQSLKLDEPIPNKNGTCMAVVTKEGDFAVIGQNNTMLEWRARASCGGQRVRNLKLQEDGNLVIFNWRGDVCWGLNVFSKAQPMKLVMQDNCNLVLLDANNKQYWQSDSRNAPDRMTPQKAIKFRTNEDRLTSNNGDCKATFVEDGRFAVICLGDIKWVSSNSCPADQTKQLSLRETGNLVLEDLNGKECWSSNQFTKLKVVNMVMQEDGNLVVVHEQGMHWETATRDETNAETEYKNSLAGKTRAFFNKVGEAFKSFGNAIKAGLQTLIRGACNAANKVCSIGCAAIKTVGNAVVTGAFAVGQSILDVALKVTSGLFSLFETIVKNFGIDMQLGGGISTTSLQFECAFYLKLGDWSGSFSFSFDFKIADLMEVVKKVFSNIKDYILKRIPGLDKLIG